MNLANFVVKHSGPRLGNSETVRTLPFGPCALTQFPFIARSPLNSLCRSPCQGLGGFSFSAQAAIKITESIRCHHQPQSGGFPRLHHGGRLQRANQCVGHKPRVVKTILTASAACCEQREELFSPTTSGIGTQPHPWPLTVGDLDATALTPSARA